MCLIVHEDEAVLTAEENIFCYKRLYTGYSSTHDFLYEKGKINKKVEFKKENLSEYDIHSGYYQTYNKVINEGYHSRNKSSNAPKTHLFIIPKGTKYITGGENNVLRDNYVSETIVYVGKNNWINKLIAKIKYK